MLQQMRKFAKSWVSSVFLGLLALSFGVWGIADIFRGNTDTTVATIGSVKISQQAFQTEYQNLLRNESARLGTQITPEKAQALGLGQDALQRMISRTAVDREVERLGLTATDKTVAEQVRSIPAFAGPAGTFDHATFLRAIEQSGFNEQSFIAAVRSDTAREQLMAATKTGLQIPPGYAHALFDYLNEVRAVHYVTVPSSAAGAVPNPPDAELEAYLKAHPDRFSTPEYRQLTYATIAPTDVMGEIKVTDDQLKQEYEIRKDQYQVPEKRDIEQITFPDKTSADEASAKIVAGTSFEDVVKSRGLKEKDIALGSLQEADLGTDRGPAAFALAEGHVSQPVKGAFGWVLLKVTKITPGTNKTFDEVKDGLRKDVLQKLAVNKIADLMNAFEDAMAGGDTLAEAGNKTGIHVVHVPSTDKQGLAADASKADVPADPQFLDELFKADIGMAGDPFQTKDGSSYVLMAEGDTPPKLKPLDQVRAAATSDWLDDARRKSLLDKAKSLAAEVNTGKSLADAAKSLGVTEEQSGPLMRGRPEDIFPAALVGTIFDAAPGTAVFGKSAKGDAYIVAQVTGVVHPPAVTAASPQYQGFLAQMGNQIGEDIPTSLAMAARIRQGVSVNQQLVERVTGGGS